MPKIPQFEATERLQPDNMAEEAMNKEAYHDERTAEVAPRLIGAGIEGIQRGLGRMDEQQAQAQTAGMMQDMANLTVQSHQQLDTTLNTADPSSGVDPMQGFNESLQEKLQAVKDKYQNPKTQEVFSRMSAELQSNLLDRGYSQWQGNVRSYTAQALDTTAQKLANAAGLDPASVDDTAKQFGSAVDAMVSQHPGMLSVDERQKLTRAGMESIYNSAAIQIVNKLDSNPNASLSDIKKVGDLLAGDNFTNNMSLQDHQRVLDDVDKAGKTREDAASYYITKSAPQLFDKMRQFGDPDGKIGKYISSIVATTPEQQASKAELVDKYGEAGAEFEVTKVIGNMPNDQVQSFIQDRKADWQNASSPAEATAAHGAYDMAVKVAKQRDEEFMKAPATYMLNHNDTVGHLYANYKRNPTPQNFQIYAAFSAGQQQKLYPGVSPNILTDDMKQDIGTRMASVTQDPQGALAAGKILSDTQQLTGQYWNEAAHELYKDKIVNGAQFASAQLLGSPKSWSLAQEGFRAASIPDDVLTKTSGISKEASDKVASDALRPLLATFADTADGHELVASYIDFSSNVMRARGKVDSGTAAALAQTAVLDRFQIKNNLRIPNDLDANDVADGGDNILAHIDQHKLVSPPSFSGAGEAVQGASYTDDIKNFGHWSTNARGDGMILYDQYGAPVYENVKGSKVPVQVEIPFATAAKLGSQIRSPLNQAYRIATDPRSVPGLTGGPSKADQALSAEEHAANPDGR